MNSKIKKVLGYIKNVLIVLTPTMLYWWVAPMMGMGLLAVYITILVCDYLKDTNDKKLVAFGNYLLSEERDNLTSAGNKRAVTHADFQNYINSKDNE